VTRVLVVRHKTLRTVSDHRAYLVTFRLPGGGYLTIGTHNLSVAAVKRQPERLLRDVIRLMGECDVLLVQEAGQGRALVERAAAAVGGTAYFGEGKPGQDADPIIVRKGITVSFAAHPLTGPTKVGQAGAGPSVLHAKTMLVARFRVGPDRVRVANVHASPSTYLPVRWLLVRRQFRRAAASLKRGRDGVIDFLGGDLNQVPGSRLLNPLRRIGLRSSQRALGELPTMGRRAIDDVLYTPEVRH